MSGHVGFALRAPWYVRERGGFDLRDARARRPTIQMYDGTDFTDRLRADPADCLAFGDDDRWSYPVPVAFPAPGRGRERFATSRLVHTNLRKLYQPGHSRFYLVVVEVFCDAPGLPRAGSHDDLDVGFVVRRQRAHAVAGPKPVRALATALMKEMLGTQHPGVQSKVADSDVPDLWWADCSVRRRFAEDKADLIAAVDLRRTVQSWVTGRAGGRWRPTDESLAEGEQEQTFPMWRIPDTAARCPAGATRSLWFGLVPTYSADMERPADPAQRPEPKLDDRGIYEIVCFARRVPEPGHEHCPPQVWWSRPTEPFRLAAPFDPDGTKNHQVRIVAPDLRRLAARAGRQPGPGGVQITTPPQSQFVFDPFKGIPASGSGSIGVGGGTCTFALELFFLVALFLFLLFLPIVVLVFQLWWLLALRFCFPLPAAAFAALEAYFATAGNTVAGLPPTDPDPAKPDRAKLDRILGTPLVDELVNREPFTSDQTLFGAAVAAANPHDAAPDVPPKPAEHVDDPLCPGSQ